MIILFDLRSKGYRMYQTIVPLCASIAYVDACLDVSGQANARRLTVPTIILLNGVPYILQRSLFPSSICDKNMVSRRNNGMRESLVRCSHATNSINTDFLTSCVLHCSRLNVFGVDSSEIKGRLPKLVNSNSICPNFAVS